MNSATITEQYREPFASALAQYGHPRDRLLDHSASPIALARRMGVPESDITGAMQLIQFPFAQGAQPSPDHKEMYIGEYSGTNVWASPDPFDEESMRVAQGLVAFHPLQPPKAPPRAAPPAPKSPPERALKTIMDALYVLGFGSIQPDEVHQPNYHKVLLSENRITHEQLGRAYAKLAHLEYIDPRRNPPKADVRHLLSPSIITRFRVVPYAAQGRELTLLMDDPTDQFCITAVEQELPHMVIAPAVTSSPDIDHLINTLYRRAEHDEALAREASTRAKYAVEDDTGADPTGPVAQHIQLALEVAANNGASDLHFQPERGGLVVRERLHGNLIERSRVPKEIAPKLTNQLMMMAGMNLEARVPQDARFAVSLSVQGRETLLRLRVNMLPTQFGKRVTMRLLRDVDSLQSLEEQDFTPENLALMEDAVAASNGMILVTGPTGSGKTTLMHSILKLINTPSRNVMSVEDPIEYEQPRISQTEVRITDDPDSSLTFAHVLRSMLRQNPDVIFVGEIRDEETANIATKAAQSGHLMLSTLHTNGAVATIGRLLDLNVPAYLIAENLRVIIGQRLVGRPCPECSVEQAIPEEYALTPGATMLHGTGEKDGQPCALCNGTGDYKVIPVHEVLAITEDVRAAIASKDLTAVAAHAQLAGMKDLRYDGLLKVAQHKANLRSVLLNVK